MITWENLNNGINEIHIVYNIIQIVKKELLYDKYDELIKKYKNFNNKNLYRENELSEDFIREFKDKVNWFIISKYKI